MWQTSSARRLYAATDARFGGTNDSPVLAGTKADCWLSCHAFGKPVCCSSADAISTANFRAAVPEYNPGANIGHRPAQRGSNWCEGIYVSSKRRAKWNLQFCPGKHKSAAEWNPATGRHRCGTLRKVPWSRRLPACWSGNCPGKAAASPILSYQGRRDRGSVRRRRNGRGTFPFKFEHAALVLGRITTGR
jgi:hypothetical protein